MLESNDYLNDPLEYATKFVELCQFQHREADLVTKLIKELVTGNLALDLGCGPGQSTVFLKSLGLDASGVDVNRHMIEAARQRDPFGRYEVIQAGEIPSEDNFYDLVYARWVLVHAASKTELLNVCKDIARILKKDGIFIMVVNTDDMLDSDWKRVYNILDTKVESGSIIATKFKSNNYVVYNYYWTEEDYVEALTNAGLKVLRLIKPMYVDGKLVACEGIGNSAVFATRKL